MSISTITSTAKVDMTSHNVAKPTDMQAASVVVQAKVDQAVVNAKSVTPITEKDKKVTEKDLKNITQAMNQFMENMNADLHFSVHEKTKQLMVRLVDEKTNKVLKEFPSHEFLDMMAGIQEYVGIILDKKA